MTNEQFYQAVHEEATLLRQHATPEQKSLLDFEDMSPNNPNRCIYGQMTGSCFSLDAHLLLGKCAIPVADLEEITQVDRVEELVLGETDSFEIHDEERDFASAIETYIYLVDSKNKELMDYIKGDSDTFEPEI